MGPMTAAAAFLKAVRDGGGAFDPATLTGLEAQLHGSLAFTGKGHATDRAVILGLMGFEPASLDADAAELLEAAALLSNVGVMVAHSKHHLHSYYVIRSSDRLVGFTDGELEVIAQVARYHRKSAPTSRHREFAALDTPIYSCGPEGLRATFTLAGLLPHSFGPENLLD